MRSRFKQFCDYLILNLCQSKTCAVASSISSLPKPTLKADTGASKTFIKSSHQHLLHSVTPYVLDQMLTFQMVLSFNLLLLVFYRSLQNFHTKLDKAWFILASRMNHYCPLDNYVMTDVLPFSPNTSYISLKTTTYF